MKNIKQKDVPFTPARTLKKTITPVPNNIYKTVAKRMTKKRLISYHIEQIWMLRCITQMLTTSL